MTFKLDIISSEKRIVLVTGWQKGVVSGKWVKVKGFAVRGRRRVLAKAQFFIIFYPSASADGNEYYK
jgi:hypothetical protein